MEASRAAVAEQPFELALLEHAEAAGQIESAAEGAFDGVVLHRDQPQEPVRAGGAIGPGARDRVDVRPVDSSSSAISAAPCWISG